MLTAVVPKTAFRSFEAASQRTEPENLRSMVGAWLSVLGSSPAPGESSSLAEPGEGTRIRPPHGQCLETSRLFFPSPNGTAVDPDYTIPSPAIRVRGSLGTALRPMPPGA
jgi:hypothetical protein